MPHIQLKKQTIRLAAILAAFSFTGLAVTSGLVGSDFGKGNSIRADVVMPTSTDMDKYKVRTIRFIDEDIKSWPQIQANQAQFVHFHNDGTADQPNWRRVSTEWETPVSFPDDKKYEFDPKQSEDIKERMPSTIKDLRYYNHLNFVYKHRRTKGVTAAMVSDNQKSDLERRAVRTIQLLDGKKVVATKTQTATIVRTATKDEVTGELSDFTPWKVEGDGWHADSYKEGGYQTVYVSAKNALLSMEGRTEQVTLEKEVAVPEDELELASEEAVDTADEVVSPTPEVAEEELAETAAQEILHVGHRQPDTGRKAAFNVMLLVSGVAMAVAGFGFVFFRR